MKNINLDASLRNKPKLRYKISLYWWWVGQNHNKPSTLDIHSETLKTKNVCARAFIITL